MAISSTHYYRLYKLSLNAASLLNPKTKAAFGLFYGDKRELFKHLERYVELRTLLAEHGIKSKRDLEVLLGA